MVDIILSNKMTPRLRKGQGIGMKDCSCYSMLIVFQYALSKPQLEKNFSAKLQVAERPKILYWMKTGRLYKAMQC